MSTFSCPVVKFELEKHPNADTLSIAHIKGWNCVVRSDEFKNETKGVYIPLDTIASESHELLGFLKGRKVKTAKLRGVYSQGVLLPYTQVKEWLKKKNIDIEKMEDLKDVLDVKKFEPTEEYNLYGRKPKSNHLHREVPCPKWLQKYTEIENWNQYPNVIQKGELVCLTEKLHGTSCRFSIIGGEYYVASKNQVLRWYPITVKRIPDFLYQFKLFRNDFCRKLFGAKTVLEPESNWWNDYFNSNAWIKEKLKAISDLLKCPNVTLFGEILGCQTLRYGLNKGNYDFYAYDIAISSPDGEGHHYLSPEGFHNICDTLEIKYCPVLYTGEFNDDVLELRNGKSTIANHIREGIVIEPLTPRVCHMGRVKLKKVSEVYLSGNYE